MNDYFVNYYINTLTRAPPFFVGMLYGYILYVFKGKKIHIPKVRIYIIILKPVIHIISKFLYAR